MWEVVVRGRERGTLVAFHDDPDAGADALVDEFCLTTTNISKCFWDWWEERGGR